MQNQEPGIIWGINKQALDVTVNEFKNQGFIIHFFVVDVSDLNQIVQVARAVKEQSGKVDILINNAGIVVGKYFHEHSHDGIDKSIKINTTALMHIIYKFLWDMIEKNERHIVNIVEWFQT